MKRHGISWLSTAAVLSALIFVVSPSVWSAGTLAQATSCSGAATPTNTEGPFFKPGSPERASLVGANARSAGVKLVISGHVLSTSCQPIVGAMLDFWQADANGQYDNSGFLLRGHQLADAQGRYRLETILPGLYPGRTRHIHVKVQAPNGPVLTTQLYFPREPGNQADMFFRPDLVLNVQNSPDGETATFDFVLSDR
jgi:protocatechuate 3,4-dioxygenase beta subunit